MAILQPSDSCAADFSALSLVIAVLTALCPALPAALGDYAAFCRKKTLKLSPSVYLINAPLFAEEA